jgi:Dolichyl-phosphate-mannose-protein mannosyltransferase
MRALVNQELTRPESAKPTSAPFETNWVKYGSVGALVLVIVFFAVVRVRLRNAPLERDEGEYAYMGQLLLQGIPPYKIACNMKLPGTYAAYAAIMAVFGETSAGIRLGMIPVNAAAAIMVFFLAKRLYGFLAGSVAGCTYAFLSARPALLALDGHATHFVVLAALAGILLLLRALDTKRIHLFFGSGLCFGLAFLMKQPGILFGLFAVCFWLWQESRRPFPWRDILVRGGALFAGMVLPFGLTCLALFHAGVFPSFWFWTWSYALQYGVITTWPDVEYALRSFLPGVIRPFVIWEIIAIGIAAPIWSRFAREHAGFVTSFFLFSCLAICPGFYFRPHYYILVLPVAALGAGIAVSAARELLLEKRLGAFFLWFPVLYFSVAFAISVRAEYRKYFRLDPVALVRKMQAGEPFPEAVVVGSYIKAHSTEQDTIAIFGSEPEICFYAERHCATSYLYFFPLMEKQKFARQMQDDMMRQVREARPRFLVYVNHMYSWGSPAQLQENRNFVETTWTYAHRDYQLVNEVAIADDSKYIWGDHASLYVFRRTGP